MTNSLPNALPASVIAWPGAGQAPNVGLLLDEFSAACQRDKTMDAVRFIASRPEIANRGSLIIELAYHEYCSRTAAGEAIDREQFCRQFPRCQEAIRQRLMVHSYFEPSLVQQAFLTSADWPQPGETLLEYRLLEELGRGALARVYLAADLDLRGRLVALKVSRHGQFEAEALARLEHPNIVPIYDVDEDLARDLQTICMPFRGRTTLCDLLDRVYDRFPPADRASAILATVRETNASFTELRIGTEVDPIFKYGSYVDGVLHLARQLSQALAYAHSRGIWHLDIKPSNILLANDGAPLLLDFNLAADRDGGFARLGGTLRYMAPEQIEAILASDTSQRPLIDGRADLFSLGVVLFELFCGTYPFAELPTAGTLSDAGRLLLEAQRRGPHECVRAGQRLAPELRRLIRHCLEFEPQRRFQSAVELTLAIESCMAPPVRFRRWCLRNWVRFLGVGAAAAILSGLFVAWQATGNVDAPNEEAAANRPGPSAAPTTVDGESEGEAGGSLHFHEPTIENVRSHLAKSDYRSALSDLEILTRKQPHPRLFAAAAFCLAALGRHDAAVSQGLDAVHGGLVDAAVQNNLGYAFMQQGNLQFAQRHLELAMESGPRLLPVCFNLATLEERRAAGDSAICPIAGWHYARRAIELAPGNGNCYLLAARLAAQCAARDPIHRDSALEQLQAALEHGLPAQTAATAEWCQGLRDHPRFAEILGTAEADVSTEAVPVLIDPLGEHVPRD